MKASRKDWYEMDVNITITVELSHGVQELLKRLIEAIENYEIPDDGDEE